MSNSKSPKLIPYPNWEAHKYKERDFPDLIEVFRVRADRCNRLWIIDAARIGMDLTLNKKPALRKPALVVYDLETNEEIRRYQIPPQFINSASFYATIAVDDTDCNNTYTYVADISQIPGLLIYSWASGEANRLEHEYFNNDPLAIALNANGVTWSWSEGIFGLALSPTENSTYNTLYFHPMIGFDEYKISTEILQNFTLTEEIFSDSIVKLGKRGLKTQATASFFHRPSGVIFYGLVQQNALGCWNTKNEVVNPENQGKLNFNNKTMQFVCDVKVDYKDEIWIVTNRLPTYMFGDLDSNEYNFRILKGPVALAIKDTVCAPTTP